MAAWQFGWLVGRRLPLVVRRLPVIGATTLAIFAGTWVLESWNPPHYRARALVRVVGAAPRATPDLFEDRAEIPIVSRAQLLRSQMLARDVVAAAGMRIRMERRPAEGLLHPSVMQLASLWLNEVTVDPDASPARIILDLSDRNFQVTGLGPTRRASYGVPVAAHGVRFTVGAKHPSGRIALRVLSTPEAVALFIGGLHARLRSGTDLLEVTYDDTDPVQARRALDRAIVAFQAMDAANERAAKVRQQEDIERRIGATDVLLRDALAARNQLRQKAGTFDSRTRLASRVQAIETRAMEWRALTEQRQELVALRQSLSRQPGSAERLATLGSSSVIANNAGLWTLYLSFASQLSRRDSLWANGAGRAAGDPDLRELDALIARREQRLLAAVDAQIAQLEERIASFGSLDTMDASLGPLARVAERDQRLQADVASRRGEEQRLRAMSQSIGMATSAERGHVEIVDAATVPSEPVNRFRWRVIAAALFLGLALGVQLSGLEEFFRGTVNDRDDLDEIRAARTLAVVPVVPHPSGGIALVARDAMESEGAEAFRTLRTNLRLSPVNGAVRSLAVTSARAGEGRSTVAANLAVVLAHQGERVLLVDCDLRHPSLYDAFQLPRSPGLADVLGGTSQFADAVHGTETEHLSVLTAGGASPTPTELLAGDAMKELVQRLSGSYDMLVLDSGPLVGPADALVVSGLADGTLLVVRAGKSKRLAVREALRQVASARVLLVGTVLNGCNQRLLRVAQAPRLRMYRSRAASTV